MRPLLTLALLLFSSIVSAGEVTLSWEAPTQNEDGSPLTDLDGFKIYQSTTSGGPYTEVADVQETVLSHTLTGLADGTYYYVATAYNTAGTESQYSGEASKTVSNIPNPPLNLTVAQNTTAYLLSISDDRVVAVPVGTVDAGTECDGATSFNNLNRVDIDDVNYVGTVRPPVVFAECG